MAGSPAFAQCVYVACNGGNQAAPAYQAPQYQAPQYQAPMPPQGRGSSRDYDDGYTAGLAARPSRPAVGPRRATTTHRAPTMRPAQQSTTRHRAGTSTTRQTSLGTTSRHGLNVSNIYGRPNQKVPARAAQSTRSRAAAPRHAVASRSARPAAARPVRVARASAAPATTHRSSPNYGQAYQDPIRDRAATYRPAVYGQSTTMASLMSRSSSYSSSTTTWSGPASLVNQGGQVCGWGARIVTNNHGYAQRQAVWVCQCPQGWRPPGY